MSLFAKWFKRSLQANRRLILKGSLFLPAFSIVRLLPKEASASEKDSLVDTMKPDSLKATIRFYSGRLGDPTSVLLAALSIPVELKGATTNGSVTIVPTREALSKDENSTMAYMTGTIHYVETELKANDGWVARSVVPASNFFEGLSNSLVLENQEISINQLTLSGCDLST